MFVNLSTTSPAQPLNLRRLNQAHHPAGSQYVPCWDAAGQESSDFGGDLDLSIHHANSPFSNRFDVLAPPPAAVTRDREFHVPGPRRRTRNSRGTKVAKKRRDAKRNRRKFAAQFLDEQLSKEIDKTLTKANIHPPKPEIIPDPPYFTPPATAYSAPDYTAFFTQSMPPAPPQLPPLNFGRIDFRDVPLLPPPRQTTSISPSPMWAGVPSWYPHIPGHVNDGVWSGEMPKFWDLSKISGQKSFSREESPKQDLQFWNANLQHRPKKQSRFFPVSVAQKPIVNLPPSSNTCRLHRCEEVLQDADTTAWSNSPATPEPDTAEIAAEKILAAALKEHECDQSTNEPPSAANLWNILVNRVTDDLDACINTKESYWQETSGGVALPSGFGEPDSTAEIDGREVPYVHSNSLLGHANESATYVTTGSDSEQVLADSAIYLADTISPLNNELSGYEMAAMPWPLTPRPRSPISLWDSLMSSPPVDNAADVATNTHSDDLSHSTDHFKSEQQLFKRAQIPLRKSPADSFCDLDIFLSMGHVENCWCRDCEDVPELVDDESGQTPLAESDDGWMLWSNTDEDFASVDTTPQTAGQNGVDEEEIEVTRQQCMTTPDWDDVFPCKPSRSQEQTPVLDEEFLGYYDDGAAFARESEEYDWLWSL